MKKITICTHYDHNTTTVQSIKVRSRYDHCTITALKHYKYVYVEHISGINGILLEIFAVQFSVQCYWLYDVTFVVISADQR